MNARKRELLRLIMLFNVCYSLKLIKLKQVPSLRSVGLRQISTNCLYGSKLQNN